MIKKTCSTCFHADGGLCSTLLLYKSTPIHPGKKIAVDGTQEINENWSCRLWRVAPQIAQKEKNEMVKAIDVSA